jgi:hypothetical protein
MAVTVSVGVFVHGVQYSEEFAEGVHEEQKQSVHSFLAARHK